MKIISTIDGKLIEHLDRHGIFGETMSYEDISEWVAEEEIYDVLLIDISEGKAEGVYTPRTLIDNGQTLPIIGLLDEQETSGKRDFEEAQAVFINQGGLYLLEKSVSPELLQACIAQAATIGKVRNVQRRPVRVFNDGDVELRVNLRSQNVRVDGMPVYLTGQEYLVMELLALRAGTVVSKEALLGHLYSGIDMPEIKIVDVFLCKIRKKLGHAAKFVDTSWGRGYIIRETAKVQNAA